MTNNDEYAERLKTDPVSLPKTGDLCSICGLVFDHITIFPVLIPSEDGTPNTTALYCPSCVNNRMRDLVEGKRRAEQRANDEYEEKHQYIRDIRSLEKQLALLRYEVEHKRARDRRLETDEKMIRMLDKTTTWRQGE